MSNTLLMGWNRAVAGREKDAMELFQSSLAFWTKKKEAKAIESFEPYIFTPHGGDMNGFFLVQGDPAKLDAIQHEKDYLNLTMQCGLVLDGFGTVRGFRGERLMQLMQDWGGLIQKY
jgi:hypothetical protein